MNTDNFGFSEVDTVLHDIICISTRFESIQWSHIERDETGEQG